jgi:hypothetical protein
MHSTEALERLSSMSTEIPVNETGLISDSQPKTFVKVAKMDEQIEVLEHSNLCLDIEIKALRKDNATKQIENKLLLDRMKIIEKEMAQMKKREADREATEERNKCLEKKAAVLHKLYDFRTAEVNERDGQIEDLKKAKSHTKSVKTKPSKKETEQSKQPSEVQEGAMVLEIEDLKNKIKILGERNEINEIEKAQYIEDAKHKTGEEEEERMQAFEVTKSREIADLKSKMAGLEEQKRRTKLRRSRSRN